MLFFFAGPRLNPKPEVDTIKQQANPGQRRGVTDPSQAKRILPERQRGMSTARSKRCIQAKVRHVSPEV